MKQNKIIYVASFLYAIVVKSVIIWGLWWYASYFVEALHGPIPFIGALLLTLLHIAFSVKIKIT